MKKLLFVIVMFLCTTSVCSAYNLMEEKRVSLSKYGQLDSNNSNARSEEPVEVTCNNSCLTIRFNVSLGQTDIIVENEYGNMAYNSSTNVSEHDVLFIPIGNLPSGTYYISIICGGGSAEGEFRIER